MFPSPPEAVSLGRTWSIKTRQFTHSVSGNQGRRKMNGCRQKGRVTGETRLRVNVYAGKWEATPTVWRDQGPSNGDKKEKNVNICNGQSKWKLVFPLAESKTGSLGALPGAWRSNDGTKQNICTCSKDEQLPDLCHCWGASTHQSQPADSL